MSDTSHDFFEKKPLVCDTCGEVIEDHGYALVSWLVVEDKRTGQKDLISFRLTHKGRGRNGNDKCDVNGRREMADDVKSRISHWHEVSDYMTSPIGFMVLIFGILQEWDREYQIKDYEGLKKVLFQLMPYVFRQPTKAEIDYHGQLVGLAEPYEGSKSE